MIYEVAKNPPILEEIPYKFKNTIEQIFSDIRSLPEDEAIQSCANIMKDLTNLLNTYHLCPKSKYYFLNKFETLLDQTAPSIRNQLKIIYCGLLIHKMTEVDSLELFTGFYDFNAVIQSVTRVAVEVIPFLNLKEEIVHFLLVLMVKMDAPINLASRFSIIIIIDSLILKSQFLYDNVYLNAIIHMEPFLLHKNIPYQLRLPFIKSYSNILMVLSNGILTKGLSDAYNSNNLVKLHTTRWILKNFFLLEDFIEQAVHHFNIIDDEKYYMENFKIIEVLADFSSILISLISEMKCTYPYNKYLPELGLKLTLNVRRMIEKYNSTDIYKSAGSNPMKSLVTIENNGNKMLRHVNNDDHVYLNANSIVNSLLYGSMQSLGSSSTRSSDCESDFKMFQVEEPLRILQLDDLEYI